MITRTAKCARNYSDLMGAKKRWNSTTAAAAAALRLSRTKLLVRRMLAPPAAQLSGFRQCAS